MPYIQQSTSIWLLWLPLLTRYKIVRPIYKSLLWSLCFRYLNRKLKFYDYVVRAFYHSYPASHAKQPSAKEPDHAVEKVLYGRKLRSLLGDVLFGGIWFYPGNVIINLLLGLACMCTYSNYTRFFVTESPLCRLNPTGLVGWLAGWLDGSQAEPKWKHDFWKVLRDYFRAGRCAPRHVRGSLLAWDSFRLGSRHPGCNVYEHEFAAILLSRFH